MIVSEASSPIVAIDAEILALSFFEDERPLRRAAGMVDWRMNGALSRLILEGKLSGLKGESMLMSTDGRIAAERLLLFGLGESRDFNPEKYQELLQQFIKTVTKLKFRKVAVAIPGSSMFSMEKVTSGVKKEFENAGMPANAEVIIIN